MDEFIPVAKIEERPFQPAGKVNEEVVKPYRDKGMTYGEIFSKYGEPVLQGLGLVGGGIAGSAVAPVAGTIAGAAGGYAIAKKTGEIWRRNIDQITGDETPSPDMGMIEETGKSIEDLGTGAMMEMGGQLGGKLIMSGAKQIGKFGKQAFGKLTGTGEASAEQAVKSGEMNTSRNPFPSQTTFDKAMRGEMDGQEVVDLARSALTRIKDARAAQYRTRLQSIQDATVNPTGNLPAVQGQPAVMTIDPKPIIDKLQNLTGQYRISLKINQSGEAIVDTSQAAMGKSGRNDVADVIKEIGEWHDFSPLGLDALKRRVADFYSDSSQARQFVTSIEGTIKKTITDAVPEYAQMTKEYEKATRLIKDLESNLMMRKEGMSGRIVSDQTLRRLTSAMKDNFELRKELVSVLQDQGGEDVMGAVAGYAMKTYMPRGITGTGAAIMGSLYAAAVNPKFWPLVLSSSPRVAGEFLRMFGKYGGTRLSEPAGRTISYGALEDNGEKEGRLSLPESSQRDSRLRMR